MRGTRVVGAMLVVCGLLVVAGARGAEPVDAGAVIARVAALEDARRAAMVAADTTTLAAMMEDDATYVHSNGLVQVRAQLFATLARGEIRYRSFTVEGVSYRAWGSTVVGSGVQRIELEASGRALASRSRFTVVYAVEGEEPRLVAYQSTSLPEIVTKENP